METQGNTSFTFMDTETDGLWKAGCDEYHPDQPRPVQIAFARYDAQGRENYAATFLIRPEPEWPALTEHSISIHGITEDARRQGVRAVSAVQLLETVIPYGTLGGHNVGFDTLVLRRFLFEIGASELADAMLTMPTADTMQMGIDVCKLPRRDSGEGYKRPSLTELHQFLFNEPIPGAHDALVDVRASARAFFEMRKRGVEIQPAVPPRTTGGRDSEEVRQLLERAKLAKKRGSREEDFVRDQVARFEQYGDRYLASDKVWSWLKEISNRVTI